MIYKCIKEFGLSKVSGEGLKTGDIGIVSKNSKWEKSKDIEVSMSKGHVRLNRLGCSSEFGWIELSKEDLKKYFNIEEKI